ncbi:hypothetical protein CVT24_012785 [Panaeolus cyanescens]|uniref:Uncharacterized protein n=1 Tax=Panaeolus cyanescens TaxID=181874 RepID=A0A409WL13_9AGAR|nr:hypothetical protein CVT24_012785 [Panaeolus cyanescens]
MSLSPPSASTSDSDELSPRVYFGPLKTPERIFLASIPPAQSNTSPLRRSPRLSTPRPQSPQGDQPDNDVQEMALVAQLINERLDEDDDNIQETEREPLDEPSSALAERISHATSNPSPPPSPTPLPMSFFDPFPPSTTQPASDYQTDLLSLNLSGSTLPQIDFTPADEQQLPPQPDDPHILIPLDTSIPQPSTSHFPASPMQVESVDDLLFRSPAFKHSPAPLIHNHNLPAENSTSPHNLAAESQPSQSSELTTPVRRSTRPRRSVTPVPPPQVFSHVGPVFTAPVPSPARTQVKRKSRINLPNEEVVSDSQSDSEDLLQTPQEQSNSRCRSKSPGKSSLSYQRELGSLSPTSTNVLETLNFIEEEPIPSSVEPEETRPSIFSAAPVAPNTPSQTGPIRFASPSRTVLPQSPTKYRLQPLPVDDPRNTPARRVIVQPPPNSVSAIPGPALPPPTPARRVLVQPEATPRTIPSKLASPVKLIAPRRDVSAEPPQRIPAHLKGKERALDTSTIPPPSSSTTIKPLPFPLIPTTPALTEAQPIPPKAKPAPVKSSLKQPSNSSRIPRIGVKPYVRIIQKKDDKAVKSEPPTKAPGAEPSTSAKRPIRLISEVSRPTASSMSRTKPAPSSVAALKRKRDEKPSPANARTTVRQNPPPTSEPSTSVSTRIQQLVAPKSSTVTAKKAEPPRYRLVQSVMPPKPPPPPSLPQEDTTKAMEISTEEKSPLAVVLPTTPRDSSPPASSPPAPRPTTPPPCLAVQEENICLGSPMNQDPPELHSSPEHPPIAILVDPSPPIVSPPPAEPESLAARRTTRARRAVINADGSVPLDTSSRSSTRRKASASRSANDDVFAGMSMTALKDLTLQNTEINQRYLTAKLETEVVKKDGIRPESPMVKIKTISQRMQDAKEKGREERAQRRARRSDEMMSSDVEMSDVGYSSPAEEEPGSEQKHTRGAGEDEDYVSPIKEFGDLRKNLFGMTNEPMAVDTKRRVKWDRGLFTTVYLDEVKLGSRETTKENRALKGILAATAKALPLDILGNLPNADTPLANLVPENVIVKKFVYESDPPPAPPVAPKNTRSRKKK